jgi:DNA-binding NarL/FixJ family response regulator
MRGAAMSEPIRVLVVDDHVRFRRGLESILAAEDDIEVVSGAADGLAPAALAAEGRPDIVLVDIDLPDRGGIRVTGAIKRVAPSAKIVMFAVSDDEAQLFEAIKAGAVGYLRKGPADEIVAAVRSVHNGMSPIGPTLASRVMNEFAARARESDRRTPAPRLTDRELEVLRLTAGEQTNHEIASRLSISANTVKHHVRNVLDKVQLSARMKD